MDFKGYTFVFFYQNINKIFLIKIVIYMYIMLLFFNHRIIIF